MPKINPYKHVTNKEIDKFNTMTFGQFQDHVTAFNQNMTQTQYTHLIDNNRPFLLYPPVAKLVKRNGQLYRIHGNSEQPLPETLKFSTYTFGYEDDIERYRELSKMVMDRASLIAGGTPYCNHVIQNKHCIHCGAYHQI